MGKAAFPNLPSLRAPHCSGGRLLILRRRENRPRCPRNVAPNGQKDAKSGRKPRCFTSFESQFTRFSPGSLRPGLESAGRGRRRWDRILGPAMPLARPPLSVPRLSGADTAAPTTRSALDAGLIPPLTKTPPRAYCGPRPRMR